MCIEYHVNGILIHQPNTQMRRAGDPAKVCLPSPPSVASTVFAQLRDYLYLGSSKAANDKELMKEQLEITHILNVAGAQR